MDYIKGTISIHLVKEALLVANSRGYNIYEIASNAGISPTLLDVNKARVSINDYAKLWIEIANTMNDEFFGMDAHAMRRGSYKLLVKMVEHSTTIEKALQNILNYFNIILDDLYAYYDVDETGNQLRIYIKDKGNIKRMFTYATYMMFIQGILCWLADKNIIYHRIQLKCSQPIYCEDYYIRFTDQIEFLSEQNVLYLDASDLKIKIKKSNEDVNDFLKYTPQKFLVRYKADNDLSAEIRNYLSQSNLQEWPELKEIALILNISEATLQRRLKNKGTSFQKIKNEIRRDYAIERLSNTKDTLYDISYALNFNDPSAFQRAFKKWTGVSAGTYRKLSQH
ncbi:AraC family transcriptional regulator ligand-binding domain-containing protein [Acinetobacter puyangensis]|uniref:AraC family transcriptional regulator n=1 Tax=Acinetobacter puyangensis TaxID=1096779 RepID=UPI003A4D849F